MCIGLAALAAVLSTVGWVAAMKGMRVTGRVSMCVECRKSAAGDDYVFAND
jgi:hypothetical protein